jgi:hypothetical protein
MKYMNVLLLSTLLFALAACSEQPNVKIDAYRYISFEDIQRIKWGKEVPRADWGKVIADPYWYLTHHMKGAVADTFFFYGNFDSIRMKTPSDTYVICTGKLHSKRQDGYRNLTTESFFI